MPPLFTGHVRFTRRLPTAVLLVIGACAGGISPNAAADGLAVTVVTDSRHPVQAPEGVRIIELDAPTRIEAELVAHLPAAPHASARIVQQGLHNGGSELQRRLAHVYQAVADAWSLGVARIPAVVVDRRYIVYGDPDVDRAIARIEAYRGAAP